MEDMNTAILDTTSEVKKVISRLTQLKEEVKLKKEMLDSEMAADKAYFEASESHQEAKEKLKAAKLKVMTASPTARSLSSQLPEMKQEVNEVAAQLAEVLSTYVSLTGSNIIEMDDGSELKIKKSFKIGKV